MMLALAAPAAAQPAAVAPPPVGAAPAAPAPTLADGYIVGVGDVIEVGVLGREEFRARVQVQVDGTIQLLYLHSVEASNQTILQLREKIRRLLLDGGFYADPVVTVAVVTYASRYTTVLGEVAQPGLVPVDRAYRLSEILARVGGVRPTAADEIVLRRASGEEIKLPVAEVASGGTEQDPYVNPGDKLYVAAAPSFYIYGQVTAAGAYRVDRGMTVRMALARGGGLNDRGSEKRIKLYRDGKQIPVDLNAAIAGGDTVVVGERFF